MGEMRKTSQKYCSKCLYYSPGSSSDWCCAYYSITKKHRECKVGMCDKFEKRDEQKIKERKRLYIEGRYDW